MFHYYCFTFVDNLDEGDFTYATTYKGYLDQVITLPRIANAREEAGVTSVAVMLSCAYLGYMTPVDFREKI